jgi:hypothetical protein
VIAILSPVTFHLLGMGYLQESEFVLREGETLNEFGQRIIPKGMKLAHPVVKGDFGPSKGNIVVLFQQQDAERYTGWVLMPEGARYKKYILPPSTDYPIRGLVEAVFFANADSDPERELLILCEHASGAGGSTFWSIYAYDWAGSGYKYLEDISDEFGVQTRYRTAQAIRNRLKQLGY